MLAPGDSAPSFELPNQDGEPVSLADFAGQYVVLYFYPKAGTEGCSIEAQRFGESADEFAARDAQIVGVSMDPVEDLAAFSEDLGLPFPLLSDEDGSVAAAYESDGEAEVDGQTFEIALRNTFLIGPDGTIEAVYEGVSPDDHAEEILADLDELAD